MRRAIIGVTLLLGTLAVGIGQTTVNHETKLIRCEEDMPCWDCETMGNGICGLTPTENSAELLERTE